jgi:vanillate/4-hydroxybenzoate decarboxylase subunit D
MICPRCDSDTAEFLVEAPVNHEWEVYICKTCYYSWRSTECDENRDPEKYDKRFKIDPKDIPNLGVIPPVPKLLKK